MAPLLALYAAARASRVEIEEQALRGRWTPRASLLVDLSLRQEELTRELLMLRAGWEAA